MIYKCLTCQSQHSIDNVAPVCAICYSNIKRDRDSYENVAQQYLEDAVKLATQVEALQSALLWLKEDCGVKLGSSIEKMLDNSTSKGGRTKR